MAEDQDVATQSVELVYRPSMADISSAVRARGRLNRRKYALRIALSFGLLFVVMAVGLYFVLGDSGSILVSVVSAALATLAGAVAGAVAYPVARRVQLRAIHRFAEAQGECRTTVDDAGLRIKAADAESAFNWALYPRYMETEDLFVALSRDKNAVGVAMLPKRGLRDPADADGLRAILDRHALRVGRRG